MWLDGPTARVCRHSRNHRWARNRHSVIVLAAQARAVGVDQLGRLVQSARPSTRRLGEHIHGSTHGVRVPADRHHRSAGNLRRPKIHTIRSDQASGWLNLSENRARVEAAAALIREELARTVT